MRISNAMMASNIKGYLLQHTRQLLNAQEKIASGKRINRPSDDPVGMGQVLGYRKAINSLEQYNRNIENGKVHIDNVENILGAVTDFLMQAKDIAGDPDPNMRNMLADQVVNIRDQVVQLANSKHNGNHLFSGHSVHTAPFADTGTGYTYQGDNGTKEYMIGDGLQLGIISDGLAIFQGAEDVFGVLQDLETHLRSGDAAQISDQLPLLTRVIENLNTVRAVNAGQHKRMEATQSHNKHFLVNAQDLLSRTEDTDMAAAIVDWQLHQTAYESTLATSAKMIQPSLIDFLR